MPAQARDGDEARVCSADLRECTLREGAAVFAAGDPLVRGDSAEVVVKAIWLAPHVRRAVQDGIFRVTLRRAGTGWTAVSVRTLRIS